MTLDTIDSLGRQRLQNLAAPMRTVEVWKSFLLGYQSSPTYADDRVAWLSCVLALEGVATSNFGVGAVLVEEGGRVVACGHNEIFQPHFRSDRHAEMVTLDRWEDSQPAPADTTLVTSLEPCPMCVVRLSSSAVRRVLHVAPDGPGGMVQRLGQLPPYWAELARNKEFRQADCSDELVHAAEQILLLNLEALTARLRAG